MLVWQSCGQQSSLPFGNISFFFLHLGLALGSELGRHTALRIQLGFLESYLTFFSCRIPHTYSNILRIKLLTSVDDDLLTPASLPPSLPPQNMKSELLLLHFIRFYRVILAKQFSQRNPMVQFVTQFEILQTFPLQNVNANFSLSTHFLRTPVT